MKSCRQTEHAAIDAMLGLGLVALLPSANVSRTIWTVNCGVNFRRLVMVGLFASSRSAIVSELRAAAPRLRGSETWRAIVDETGRL